MNFKSALVELDRLKDDNSLTKKQKKVVLGWFKRQMKGFGLTIYWVGLKEHLTSRPISKDWTKEDFESEMIEANNEIALMNTEIATMDDVEFRLGEAGVNSTIETFFDNCPSSEMKTKLKVIKQKIKEVRYFITYGFTLRSN